MKSISFVVPSFNRVEWLAPCIDSLLTQTVEDIEIIIVNDCSTDGTKELLNDWYSKNPKIKIIHNSSNMGGGESRNIGMRAASSSIIAVCDDDDCYIETRAQDILDWFEKHPESELVNFPYISIDYFDDPLESFNGAPFDHELFRKDGSVTYFCNPAAAYKKNSAIEMGGYPKEVPGLTDDYQFITNWVGAGKKIDFCGDDGKRNIPYATLHRILPDSMMSKNRGFDPKWLKK